jgi:16S rRNA (adenine1518-N6/adenine1519-N6)-dimethyltransferase
MAGRTRTTVIESQLALLRRHGIRPVKRRGQNFLLDGNLARAIAQEAAALGKRVLELGAGGGALTGPLLDLCDQVTCVEVDRHLCRLLGAEFGDRDGFTLLEADLARLQWAEVLAGAGPRPVVAGNLPYVLTSKVLFALAECQAQTAGAVLMVQKEVAERLIARPGGRDHGLLAVVMGSLFEVSMLRTVPAKVFWPRPEVSSAVVRLLPGEPWPMAEYRSFLATVKPLFQQRRKQLGTALRHLHDLEAADLDQLAREAGCELSQRPEQLSLVVWRQLARALSDRGLV